MKSFALITAALLVSEFLPASAVGDDAEPAVYYTLAPGSYALIGQFPDGGATYKGMAEITYQDDRLQLVKHIENKAITAEGKVERANPGETNVLRFRWPEHEETCLVSIDLDNYSRLSCYWTVQGTDHKQPGLEAYFSTETWP
jgi:hypothetical protein